MIHNKPPSNYLSEFLNFISKAQSHYKFCLDELSQHDERTWDFVHSYELDELNFNERGKLGTQFHQHLKDRRYYKDRVEELEPIITFFTEPQNKKVLNDLTQVLGKVRKAEGYHKHRTYIPKVLKQKKENNTNEENNNN